MENSNLFASAVLGAGNNEKLEDFTVDSGLGSELEEYVAQQMEYYMGKHQDVKACRVENTPYPVQQTTSRETYGGTPAGGSCGTPTLTYPWIGQRDINNNQLQQRTMSSVQPPHPPQLYQETQGQSMMADLHHSLHGQHIQDFVMTPNINGPSQKEEAKVQIGAHRQVPQKRARIPPYPPHVRWQVVELKVGGMKQKDIASFLDISVNTVYRVLELYKKTGSIITDSVANRRRKGDSSTPKEPLSSLENAGIATDVGLPKNISGGPVKNYPELRAKNTMTQDAIDRQEVAEILAQFGPTIGDKIQGQLQAAPESGQQHDMNNVKPKNQSNTTDDEQHPSEKPQRTAFTVESIVAFEEVFSKTHFPSSQTKVDLAEKFGVPLKSVTNWFSNRRSRFNRQKKKQKKQSSIPSQEGSVYSGYHSTQGLQNRPGPVSSSEDPRMYQYLPNMPSPASHAVSWDSPYGGTLQHVNNLAVQSNMPTSNGYTNVCSYPTQYWPYQCFPYMSGMNPFPYQHQMSNVWEPLGLPTASSTPAPPNCSNVGPTNIRAQTEDSRHFETISPI